MGLYSLKEFPAVVYRVQASTCIVLVVSLVFLEITAMRLPRRAFLATAAAGLTVTGSHAAPTPERTEPALKYRLGIVTYNIAADWDVPTILRVCRNVGLAAVELRTTHRHGVEPSMSAQARKEVR